MLNPLHAAAMVSIASIVIAFTATPTANPTIRSSRSTRDRDGRGHAGRRTPKADRGEGSRADRTTSDDLPVVLPMRDNPLSFFGTDAAAAKAAYFAGGAGTAGALQNIAVDITHARACTLRCRARTAAGQPAWLYRFDYVAESLRPTMSGNRSGDPLTADQTSCATPPREARRESPPFPGIRERDRGAVAPGRPFAATR
jgi:hypothetical protein